MTTGHPGGASGRQAFAPSRRIALVIWSALLAGVLAFAVIGTALGPVVPRREAGGLAFLLWIALVLAIVNFLLSRIVPGRMKKAAIPTPDGLAMARTIVAAACNEGAALLSVIVWLLLGQPLVVVPFAISIAGLLLAFPSETRWRALSATPSEAQRANLVR